jgi:hypothetical protein
MKATTIKEINTKELREFLDILFKNFKFYKDEEDVKNVFHLENEVMTAKFSDILNGELEIKKEKGKYYFQFNICSSTSIFDN